MTAAASAPEWPPEWHPEWLPEWLPESSTLVVNVQIAVPRGTPAAERVFALADRLHALAVDDADAERASTSVAVLVDETGTGTPDARPAAPPAPVPELVLLVDRRLRAKLGGRGPVITTVRGIGYRMDRRSRITVVRDPSAGSEV
jgi:hypothetical protein